MRRRSASLMWILLLLDFDKFYSRMVWIAREPVISEQYMLRLHMKRRRLITLRSDFLSILARHEIGMREMTRLAGIGHATIHQILHPETDSRRTGGMQEKTAWKIVNAFSKK